MSSCCVCLIPVHRPVYPEQAEDALDNIENSVENRVRESACICFNGCSRPDNRITTFQPALSSNYLIRTACCLNPEDRDDTQAERLRRCGTATAQKISGCCMVAIMGTAITAACLLDSQGNQMGALGGLLYMLVGVPCIEGVMRARVELGSYLHSIDPENFPVSRENLIIEI